jgi:pyrrolidone-carboxylate peptidase
MSKLLWTGFEPFGDLEFNPSMTAARAAAEASGGRFDILSVTYRAVRQWHADPTAPRDWIWIHLGVGRSRDAVCVEQTAYNHVAEDQPDESGRTPHPRLVDVDGAPDALSTAFDPRALVDAYRRENDGAVDDARLSDDPGRFVCNAMYFRSLLGRSRGDRLFVHIPQMTAESATAVGHTLARAIGRCC